MERHSQWKMLTYVDEFFLIVLVCVPFGESKNKFLILDLPDFVAERNAKSKIGTVPVLTFRKRVQ